MRMRVCACVLQMCVLCVYVCVYACVRMRVRVCVLQTCVLCVYV